MAGVWGMSDHIDSPTPGWKMDLTITLFSWSMWRTSCSHITRGHRFAMNLSRWRKAPLAIRPFIWDRMEDNPAEKCTSYKHLHLRRQAEWVCSARLRPKIVMPRKRLNDPGHAYSKYRLSWRSDGLSLFASIASRLAWKTDVEYRCPKASGLLMHTIIFFIVLNGIYS